MILTPSPSLLPVCASLLLQPESRPSNAGTDPRLVTQPNPDIETEVFNLAKGIVPSLA
jgi:hypothetical protein